MNRIQYIKNDGFFFKNERENIEIGYFITTEKKKRNGKKNGKKLVCYFVSNKEKVWLEVKLCSKYSQQIQKLVCNFAYPDQKERFISIVQETRNRMIPKKNLTAFIYALEENYERSR